jgi:hypothetical protein
MYEALKHAEGPAHMPKVREAHQRQEVQAPSRPLRSDSQAWANAYSASGEFLHERMKLKTPNVRQPSQVPW